MASYEESSAGPMVLYISAALYIPRSYNYPHLILEETKVTCSKVTLQNSLGFELQSDKEFWFWGSEGEWLTAQVHTNLQRGHIELAVGIAIT